MGLFVVTVKALALLCAVVPRSVSAMDPFHVMDGQEVVEKVALFQKEYPEFVKATTSQAAFGLPLAGENRFDCDYDRAFEGQKQTGCQNHFFTIQDYTVHIEGSESSNALPELLWVGALHGGDDQLGPTVVMETAALLLEAASCEAKPRLTDRRKWDEEVAEALACRKFLKEQKGIDDAHRQWLARLVSTRRIVVVPNANALGMSRKEYLEDGVDPALDFPYNNANPTECMRTIAARTLNELFLSHMFQVVVFFERGQNGIYYSWGTQPALAPDLICMFDFSEAMSMVAGGKDKYPFGEDRPQDERDRFQDWSYAASWENIRVQSCFPETYGGYDSAKTSHYPVSTNRAVAFTVSTQINNDIEGELDQLGMVMDIFHGDDNTDGLAISRNIRIALVSADLVQPYASIIGVNEIAIADDIVPSTPRADNLCDTSRALAVSSKSGSAFVEWTVGGSLNINQTDLWVARSSDFHDYSACGLTFDENNEEFSQIFQKVPYWGAGPNAGTGFFSSEGPNPYPWTSFSRPWDFTATDTAVTPGSTPSFLTNSMGSLTNQPTTRGIGGNQTSSINLLGPVFRARIDLSNYQAGDMLVLVATTKVDAGWGDPPSDYYQVSNARSLWL
jgi:hypothetical protein